MRVKERLLARADANMTSSLRRNLYFLTESKVRLKQNEIRLMHARWPWCVKERLAKCLMKFFRCKIFSYEKVFVPERLFFFLFFSFKTFPGFFRFLSPQKTLFSTALFWRGSARVRVVIIILRAWKNTTNYDDQLDRASTRATYAASKAIKLWTAWTVTSTGEENGRKKCFNSNSSSTRKEEKNRITT